MTSTVRTGPSGLTIRRFAPLLITGTLALVAGALLAAAVPKPHIEFLNSRLLPPGLPFSEAVRVGDLLFLSGKIGSLPGKRELPPGGIRAEARQAMENIKGTLEVHGYALGDLVKCTVMLADMAEWSAFNEVYVTYFDGRFPARSALGANGLALGARVEVECIAAKAP
jgi:reactive intermediate/imine deaminase